MTVPNTSSTVNRLIDVVIFAYEGAEKMVPVAISELKAMLPICNRPMIWYCLQPLVKAGFTNFYICVSKDYEIMQSYLRSAFKQQVQFHFVVVTPRDSVNEKCEARDKGRNSNVTMCEAVRCFLQYKAQLPFQPTATSSESPLSQSLVDFPLSSNSGGDVASRSSMHFYLHSLAEPRDALLLDCDTFLCDIDMENFAKNFYDSLSSVTMMLMKPIDAPNSRQAKLEKEMKKRANTQKGAGSPSQTGGGGSKGGASKLGISADPRSFQYEYSCVVYEEEEDYYKELNYESCRSWYPTSTGLGSPTADTSTSRPSMGFMGGGGGGFGKPHGSPSSVIHSSASFPIFPSQGVSNSRLPSSATTVGGSTSASVSAIPVMGASGSPSPSPLPPPPPQFHRLHVISSPGLELELNVTLQYAAKRPHLRFERGLVNPQVYMVRNWVLQYMAEACDKCGEKDADLREDPIPFLSISQHTVVNKRQNVLQSPAHRIDYNIPTHWFFERGGHGRQCPIATLCASSQQFLPDKADSLRVSGVIYEESPQSLRRIYRIHSWNNYLAANEEIVGTRVASMRLSASPTVFFDGGRIATGTGAESLPKVGAATLHEKGEWKYNPTPHLSRLNSSPADVEDNFSAKSLIENEQQRLRLEQQVQHSPFLDPFVFLVSSGDMKAKGSNAPIKQSPWTFRQQGLSLLLPDTAITMVNKRGSQALHIRDSFIRSIIPPHTYVTRCVIGRGVNIAPGARLTDSVIMAGAEIGEGAEVIQSIIGKCAFVHKNVKLENCVVQFDYEVKESAKDQSLYWY